MANDNQRMDTPMQVIEGNIRIEVNRVRIPFLKLVVLGIIAGMFIALGGAASSVAMHNVSNVGVARFIGGAIFPVGLMLIVFVGGELFTGDCLLILGVIDKKVKVLSMIKVLIIVWISNLVGAVIVSGLVCFSGQFDYTNGLLGAYTIKVAYSKANMSFLSAFTSGILCNVFVCGAILIAASAKDIAGKVLGIFFPIMAFVVSGYEHCVANMYYIPAGIFASASDKYVGVAMEQYGLTPEQISSVNWSNFFVTSSIPVTLGNMVGGMLLVGAVLYYVYYKNIKSIQADAAKDKCEAK